jgi:hypothetical protein
MTPEHPRLELPATVPWPERPEAKPCEWCGQPIEPGRLYVVGGPSHIACGIRRQPLRPVRFEAPGS